MAAKATAVPVVEPDVIEEGIRCCYRVQSRSKPGEFHFVALTENGGIGECTCQNFLYRCQPRINKGGDYDDGRTACHHIRQARAFFTKQTLIGIARMETEKTK